MITATDLEYHTPEGADHEWAETYFLPIPLPKEHLLVAVYVVVRPVVGVMTNDIVVYSALADNRFEMAYLDVHQHLPAPKRFSDIDSPSGLKIKACKPPTEYRIDYVGYDDTEIHVDWKGIMEPWDIHDPKHSPRVYASEAERMAGTSMSSGYRGHFDMTGRVTGTIKLRGKELRVDAIDRMDHSWGERNEMTVPSMNSISVTIGEDFALRLLARLDVGAPTSSNQKLAHGYVLDHGELHSLVDMELLTTRAGSVVTGMDMKVTDVRGKVFHLHALPDVGAPWMAYGGSVCFIAMMRWVMNGRVGHGVVMENLSFRDLQRTRGRTWADMPSAFSG